MVSKGQLAEHIQEMQYMTKVFVNCRIEDMFIHEKIMRSMQENFMEKMNWREYFSPYNCAYNDWDLADIFYFGTNKNYRAIRKFGGVWVVVKVKKLNEYCCETETTDDFPYHHFPKDIPSSFWLEELMWKVINGEI